METRPFGPKSWDQLPPEVQAYILVLEEALRQSLERIAQLEQRFNELEARLNRNSSNSSQPPSQDPPLTPKKTKSEKSGRVPGGRPGHQGNHREHLPADKVDQIVEYRAEACPHCYSFLHESMGKQLPPRERHRVWELPEIRPHITEHRLLSGWCPWCQVWVKPELPAEVGRSAFGSRLQAWVAILTGRFRQSRRQVSELLRELCGVNLSLGSVQTLYEETSEALAAPYQEVKEAVTQADMAQVDETGWKEKGKRHWLWVAVTSMATLFLVSCSRGKKALQELIGEYFQGIVHSDRWSAYALVDNTRRQLCWAHLKRDFQALSERKTRAGPLGAWGAARDTTAFCHLASLPGWRDHLGRDALGTGAGASPFGQAFASRRLLRRSQGRGHVPQPLEAWPALPTFAFIPGVEPTNNRAERSLRGAVLWRKGCFGNQSHNGSRFTERILTIVATLRQQDRNIVEYVVAAILAQRTGQLAPSLLPVASLLIEAA